MSWINKEKWSYIIASVILFMAGLAMALYPQLSLLKLCNLLGAVMVLFGIIKIIGYYSKDRYGLAFQFDFAMEIISLVVGILMLLRSEQIVTALPVLFGVLFLIDGAFKMQTALDALKFGMDKWWAILILALLTCICGLLLVLNSIDGAVALTILFGITLMVYSIQNLCVVIYTVKTIKK